MTGDQHVDSTAGETGSASGASRFERVYRIRFSHCDPAGIVYFPQYLVLFNHLVEDWFTEGLGVSYTGLISTRRVGLPMVHLECDFRAISRMGDEVSFILWPDRVGTKSIAVALEARVGSELRVSSRQVMVCTHLDTHRSMTVPPDIRAAIAALAAS